MTGRRDPLAGLRPSRPPAGLRVRVLEAAGEAARNPREGIVALLVADRTLRWLAAVILVLAVLNAVAGSPVGGRQPAPRVTPIAFGDEDVSEIDVRSTAAEQAPGLATILDGRRG